MKTSISVVAKTETAVSFASINNNNAMCNDMLLQNVKQLGEARHEEKEMFRVLCE